MDEITLKVTDIIIANNTCYRVIYIKQDMCVLCTMEITKLELLCMQTQEIFNGLRSGNIRLEPTQQNKVVDFNAVSEEHQKVFVAKRDFIRDVEQCYGPTFLNLSGHKRKKEFDALIEKHRLPRSTAWRYIRTYLQSGMDEISLFPNSPGPSAGVTYSYSKKTGRQHTLVDIGIIADETVENHFKEALDYYKSGRAKTIKNAFDRMNMLHYIRSEITEGGQLTQRLAPASERPTFRQFEYYVKKNLSLEEKDRIKTSAREQRNDKRLLISDNLQNVMGPGDCIEMDEVEVDISLVSQIDNTQSVGRPIVYAMIDVYTRMILAVSIAFDNNSVIGLTNCLINLAEDKVTLCEKYGLNIAPQMWVSGIIPRTIRSDRGSEYRSKEAKRIFNELNINLELVPGGTGSLKGSVEQWFHQLHSSQNPTLERNGLITKRHDSKHHQEAVLTIEDFKKILYSFVVTHNQTYMANYPLTHEMIAKKVQPIPSVLWQYGETAYGSPRMLTNMDQYLYALLHPITVRLSKKGITYKGLYYMDHREWGLRQKMYALGNRSQTMEMRIDPRDVGALYMLDEKGHLMRIPLNEYRTGNNYHGVSLSEYSALHKAKKHQDKSGELYNEELRVGLLSTNERTLFEAAKAASIRVKPKNIREARTIEKKLEANKISERKEALYAPTLPAAAEDVPTVESAKKPYKIPTTVDEAFALFEEDEY